MVVAGPKTKNFQIGQEVPHYDRVDSAINTWPLEIGFEIQKFEKSKNSRFLNSNLKLETLGHVKSHMTFRFEFGSHPAKIHCCKYVWRTGLDFVARRGSPAQ